MEIKTNKGQFQIGFMGLIITGSLTLAGVIGSSIITSWATISKKTSEIDKEVALIKNTEELHYKELKELLGTTNTNIMNIGNKLDKVLEKK